MNFDLSSLAARPGVLQAALTDDSGRLLGCAGESEPPATAILVLAHATLAAASELGRRSGSGECHEILQQHDSGCIYLRSLPEGRVLLVRCHSIEAIPALRSACQQLAAPLESARPPASSATLDLASALHAEPAW